MMPGATTHNCKSVCGYKYAEVFEAMCERRDRLRIGKSFDDGRKLALVLEGGGMRAAGPAGAVVRLAQLGFSHVFDDVYATSAGVMNGAYFLSGQSEMGITIYHDDLASRRFVNPWRVWKIMDLDWVFREVICGTKPLDIESLLSSYSNFYVSMTEFGSGEPRLIDVKRAQASPLTILKAAMAIPLLYNRSIPVDGVACFDGGLLNPFPIQNAIDRGCTHVLILSSRHAQYVRKPDHFSMSIMFDMLFARGSKNLRGMLARYPEVDRLARDMAYGRVLPDTDTRIATLCFPEKNNLKRSTTERNLLVQASQCFGDQLESAISQAYCRYK